MRRHLLSNILLTNCGTNGDVIADRAAPSDDDIFDIHRVDPDGQVVLAGSYRVDGDGNMQWLTPDGCPPPDFT